MSTRDESGSVSTPIFDHLLAEAGLSWLDVDGDDAGPRAGWFVPKPAGDAATADDQD